MLVKTVDSAVKVIRHLECWFQTFFIKLKTTKFQTIVDLVESQSSVQTRDFYAVAAYDWL